MTTETAVKKRFKPYQLSIAFGVGIGTFTMISGIVPQLTGWKSTSLIHREVFAGIPTALVVAFYTVIPMMLIWGSLRFADRIRNWERGAPDRRKTTPKNVKRRLADYRAGVYMRTLLRDSAAGLMHSMIYFGFLVLLGVTTVLEIDHQMPEALNFYMAMFTAVMHLLAMSLALYLLAVSFGQFCADMFSGPIAFASKQNQSTH